jgi:hypothetical protein
MLCRMCVWTGPAARAVRMDFFDRIILASFIVPSCASVGRPLFARLDRRAKQDGNEWAGSEDVSKSTNENSSAMHKNVGLQYDPLRSKPV